MNSILFFVTELAGLTHRHRYQPRAEVVEKVWKRLQPEAYKTAKSEWTNIETSLAPTQERIEEVVKGAGDQIHQVLHEAVEKAQHASSSSQAEDIVQEVQQMNTQELKQNNPGLSTMSNDQVEQVKQMIVSQTRCAFGTQKEEDSIQQFSQETGVQVQDGNNKFYKKWVDSTCKGTRWGFGGYVDGLTEDAVVEVKNRIRRFFTHIPEYEQVQLQAYMQVLDMDKAIHIQQFNGQQRQKTVDRDDVFWMHDIQPALGEAAELLELFCGLPFEEQATWLSLDLDAKEAYLDALNRISLQ